MPTTDTTREAGTGEAAGIGLCDVVEIQREGRALLKGVLVRTSTSIGAGKPWGVWVDNGVEWCRLDELRFIRPGADVRAALAVDAKVAESEQKRAEKAAGSGMGAFRLRSGRVQFCDRRATRPLTEHSDRVQCRRWRRPRLANLPRRQR